MFRCFGIPATTCRGRSCRGGVPDADIVFVSSGQAWLRRRRRRPRQKRRRSRWSPTVERSWNASFPNSIRALLFFSALVGRADLLIFGRCGKMVCKSRRSDVAPRREGFFIGGVRLRLCPLWLPQRFGFFFVLWWFCLFLARVGFFLFVLRSG